MTPREFVEEIACLRFEGVFNPYRDVCPVHDSRKSPQMRRENLLGYIEAAASIGVDTIWMGRDLGYRGGRRTGLPLTDEGHLAKFAERYPGSDPSKATRTEIVIERTATEIWCKISDLRRAPFLWNVFPFHPHEISNPMTNRRYKAHELNDVDDLNNELVKMLKIRKVLAIGRDAQAYARNLGLTVEPIRHPSYGGLREFRDGIARLYPETNRNAERGFNSFSSVPMEGIV